MQYAGPMHLLMCVQCPRFLKPGNEETMALCNPSYSSFQKYAFLGEMFQLPAQMTHVISLEKVAF